jgi:hypothetical protein
MLFLKNLWHTTVISGSHEKKIVVLILPTLKVVAAGEPYLQPQ